MADRPRNWKEWFANAFSTDGDAGPLDGKEQELLEKVARGVVARGMTAPALLFLESMRPVSYLSGQTLLFFGPMLELVLKREEVERASRLLERRDVLEMIAVRIEALEAEKRG
ncbi:MAG: hypothetical protein HUU15_07170 [Candidatus Brocadiae bacterium]|nr:hypothetical protein [Candidatus Brocadiia bacterium]